MNERIPLSWMFDPQVERKITRRIFDEGSPYIGSKAMIPERGDFRALELSDNRRILLHGTDDSCALLSNICPHQKGLIIDPSFRGDKQNGNLGGRNFSCPLHRFAYDEKGKLAFHPMYESSYFEEKEKLCLDRQELMEWNGLLFPKNDDLLGDLQDFPLTEEFDLSRYKLVAVETDDYPHFGWIRFIDNYQEITHVAPFHKGSFAQLVDCRAGVEWKFGKHWSVQYAKWNPRTTPTISPQYALYKETVFDIFGETPQYGALWAAVYPNVMIEWYPLAMVISSLWPLPGNRTRNVMEYYVRDEVMDDHEENLTIAKNAYNLTAKEDGEICDSTEAGRKRLWFEGSECDDHPHPRIDAGMIHFRRWLHAHLNDIK